jgi:hypothetical protein
MRRVRLPAGCLPDRGRGRAQTSFVLASAEGASIWRLPAIFTG